MCIRKFWCDGKDKSLKNYFGTKHGVSNPNSWFQGTASGLMTTMSLLSIHFAKNKMSAEKGSHMEMHWRWKPILLCAFFYISLAISTFFFHGKILQEIQATMCVTCWTVSSKQWSFDPDYWSEENDSWKKRPKYLTALIYSEGNHRRIKG